MSAPKHTPGPWKIVFGKVALCVARSGCLRDEGIIADCRNHRDEEESKANALLIAAAPELLAALKEAIDTIDVRHFPTADKKIRAAIAKAEGATT